MSLDQNGFIRSLQDKYNLPTYIDSYDAKDKIFDEMWSGDDGKSIYIAFQDNTYTYATTYECEEVKFEEPKMKAYGEDIHAFSYNAYNDYREFKLNLFKNKEKDKRRELYLNLKQEFGTE